MFSAIALENIPMGKDYIVFRLWLLQQIGVASASHWNIELPSTILCIFAGDVEHLIKHINRQLITYVITNRLTVDAPVITWKHA